MTPSKQRFFLGAILLIGLILRIVFVMASAPTDDAYITFRYADNLAAGHGFVYNPGERVLGTTTPLFTIVLVPFAAAGLPPALVAWVMAVVFDLVICVLVYRLLRPGFGSETALLAAFLYAVSYVAVSACGYGMETQLFGTLLVASLVLVVARRYEACAVTTGLAVLTRPEGALFAAVLAVFVVLRVLRGDDRFPWRALLWLLAVVGPWILFAWLYFGSPLPNSALAKLIQKSTTAGRWLDFFFLRNPLVVLWWIGAAVGFGLGVAKRSAAAVLLAAWLVVYTVFFLASRPPFLGGWYFPPAALALVVLTAVAASEVIGRILRGAGRGALAAALLAVALDAVALPRSLATTQWHRQIADKVYRPLGRWVAENTQPGDIIHASDIGYLGYLSNRRILDAAALVTPAVWRYYSAHRDERDWDIAFVLHAAPDLVVLPIRRDIPSRFLAGEFAARYEPVRRFQVEGATHLHPDAALLRRYERESRFMADYIVYRKR